jgi:hypothetical protein
VRHEHRPELRLERFALVRKTRQLDVFDFRPAGTLDGDDEPCDEPMIATEGAPALRPDGMTSLATPQSRISFMDTPTIKEEPC